jgi:hypothetical protein
MHLLAHLCVLGKVSNTPQPERIGLETSLRDAEQSRIRHLSSVAYRPGPYVPIYYTSRSLCVKKKKKKKKERPPCVCVCVCVCVHVRVSVPACAVRVCYLLCARGGLYAEPPAREGAAGGGVAGRRRCLLLLL